MSIKSKNITTELATDKAKRDASYEYDKSSLEPVGEGAFKGALASGLLSRIAKTQSGKREAAIVAAGTAIGGLAGKKYNDGKVQKAERARRWLSDNRTEKGYMSENKDIYKKSSQTIGDQVTSIKKDPYGSALSIAEESSKAEKKSKGGIVKDSMFGAALGAGLGVFTKGKMRGMAMKRGAAIGGAGVAASDVVDNGSEEAGFSKSRPGQIAGMGASFAASGAIEPFVNRLMGRYSKDKTFIHKEEASKVKMKGSNHGTNLPVPKPGKSSEFLKGHYTKGKGFGSIFKGLGKPTLKAAGKYGLMGLAAGAGLDYLTHKKPKNEGQVEKVASVQFTASEAIKGNTYKARESAKGNLFSDAVTNSAVAGAGMLVAERMFKPSSSKELIGAGAAYMLGKTLFDFGKRYKAKEYLGKTKAGKLAELQEDVNSNHLGANELYKAVVLNNVMDK